MAFERYVPAKTTTTQPKATIRPTGLLSFDAAAVEAFDLGGATHAVLFFDPARKLVGVKPVEKAGEDGAFKLSKRRGSVSLKAPDFFARYGLVFSAPQICGVGRDSAQGMVTVDVKKVPRRRGRPRKQG